MRRSWAVRGSAGASPSQEENSPDYPANEEITETRVMRIAIGGLMHESNTFAASRTTVSDFESGGLETGAGIASRWGEAHHEVGGFFQGATEFGFEPVPTLMGSATPAGPLTAETFGLLSDRLIASLCNVGPVDAVLLALHGAMVAEGEPDADGAILARVRDLIGPHRPLIATLDYHANVSARMAEMADALVAYRTYPHVDQRQRGRDAARLALQAARGEVRLTQALAKPPLLIHLLAQETGREPMRSLMTELNGNQSRGYLHASILAGFPYADVFEAGPSCVVVTDNDAALAQDTADRLAARLWSMRGALTANPPGPKEAVAQALAAAATPVILVDLGDNIGGGSAADSTVLMHELVAQRASGAIVVLYDPEGVAACVASGVGNSVSLAAGGKIDSHAPPLSVAGHVRLLHDGRYVESLPRHGGIRENDQGRTAVIETVEGNTVVLNSLRHPPFSLGQLTSLGLRPERARVIVVKAAVAYKAAYEPIAGTIIPVDTPGLTAANPARYNYREIRRPILPLDPEHVVEAALNP